MPAESIFILYVRDQARSARFYAAVLAHAPRLDVPGMTEFLLPGGGALGLMPEAGIVRLLGAAIIDPADAGSAPRAELYLRLEHAAPYVHRAVEAGAQLLSPLLPRDWGDHAAYLLDPDGHVLALAEGARGAQG